MIRINLLAIERERAKKKVTFQSGQKMVAGCTMILVLAGLFMGWRFFLLARQSKDLDAQISAAQQETVRLHSIIQQVQQFEQQRAQLQQRVVLIEQLRKDQTGPVHMLDQISRALPPMLWLTELKQSADANEVVISGRCTTLTGLSDFVSNLESSGYFKRSIEIVSSSTEPAKGMANDVVRFSIKAVFQQPGAPKPATPPASKTGG